MSFFFKKNNENNKAKLEYKLYLAREDPGPVFDLSDCGLKNIPAGTYVLCKVFRKTILCLQKNQLSSLLSGNLQDLSELEVLDLHSNNFTTLPNDINLMSSLIDLDVSNNSIKMLPDSIGALKNLKKLNLANNNLKKLPTSIGNLRNLKHLNLSGNKNLDILPDELCHASSLQEIILDASAFVYPPASVVSEGLQHIMEFLCRKTGLDYKSSSTSPDDSHMDSNMTLTENNEEFDEKEKYLQEKIRQLEILKEQKQKERLNLERELENHQKKELEIRTSMKASKDKLLDDLVEQQNKLENEIFRLQQIKELERQKFIRQLQEVEESASIVVSKLLALSENSRNSAQVQHLLAQEREEEERLLNMRQEEYQSLRRKEVLDAMESLLEEEGKHEVKLREYEEGRAVTTKTLLSQEVEMDKELMDILTKHDQAQIELVTRIQENEELQRAAVAALLEKSDARSLALVHQVAIVETQLAALTAVEMERRKLEMTDHIADISETRRALSSLLLELLLQQSQRRKQLFNMLEEMERRRDVVEFNDSAEDFWLMQYQRLLDSRPYSLVKFQHTLDPLLTQYFVLMGAIHCLPFLMRWVHSPEELSQLTDAKLKEAGITLSQDRLAILEAINSYLTERQEMVACSIEPSAPLPDPSAPPDSDAVNSTECIICMELTCEVIFIPCGHLCCCIKCTERVNDCPLCRVKIEQKIRVIRS